MKTLTSNLKLSDKILKIKFDDLQTGTMCYASPGTGCKPSIYIKIEPISKGIRTATGHFVLVNAIRLIRNNDGDFVMEPDHVGFEQMVYPCKMENNINEKQCKDLDN